MKRLLFLSFIIIVTFCMTLMAYASTGIESVLAAVKSKITVPEDYTIFESSSHEFAGKTEWNFWWRTQEQNGKAANEISVTADSQGNIKRYYHFKDEYITSDTSAHFSKYDKSDARIFALRFVSKVCPELIDKIELNQYSLTPDITRNLKTARVSFYRIENKIPYYANYMNFVIDLDTSDVVEYECNWDYDLVFPAADEVITPQAARRAYEEDAGIELRYRMKMENNNKQAYLVYTTVDEEKMVDAITGEIINGSVYTIRRPIDIYARNEAEVLKDASKVTFTEQEILELNSIEKVMTISQAEEYVRSIPQLSISNDYTLKSSSFTKSDSRYLINLEFVKLPNKSSDELTDAERAMIAAGDYSYVRLTVDAANMDIVRLFQYNKEAERLDYKVLEHNAKSRVDDFIANYLKNKYINCRYKGVQKLDGGNTYKFDYICMLSGVPFEGNGITVYFDASIGIIKSIICNWQFNVNVEGAKDIISLNDGKNLIFKYAPMQLAYVNKINYNIENYISGEKPEVVLVYMLNPFIPKNILAKTGELVTNDAKPFNIIQYKKFIDIEGHYAQEQIQKLSNNLIIDENGYYYPDASITQADFLKMLFAGIKGYKYDNITDLYSNAIRNKIISEEDKNPEAEIIREDAVVYFIRMLGLESVAQLKDIYLVEYSDTSNISKDKIGYIALAKGFKIIGDNPDFEPKKALTRADAAVMVYNYLNRNN